MHIESLKNTLFENIDTSNGLFTKHYHDTYTIGITHSGLFKSINLNTSINSYKNSTRVVNPYDVHHGNSESWSYTNFYPSIELMKSVYKQIYMESKIPLFNKHILEDIILYKSLLNLFLSIYHKEDTMKIETNLISSLSYLIKNYTNSTKEDSLCFNQKGIISTSLEYINDTINENINLDTLANVSKLSKYHFLRVFKQHTGLTPHHYILTLKVQKARNMIIQGNGLLNTSYELGFSDQSHFIRNFRKIYGYSPKKLLEKSNFILYK